MLDVNHATRYYVLMPIRTFKCADTEALFRLRRVARLVNIERPALRKLKQLDDARRMEDLRAPPANRLEQLKGDRAGQWSLRVNHQFRIRFGGRAAMPKTWRSSTITEVERNEQETQTRVARRDAGRGIPQAAGHEQLPAGEKIGVPAQRIGEIIAGKRAITADTDLRLCRFFGLSDGWWLRLQADYDIEVAKASLAKSLAQIKPWKESVEQTADAH